jgi:hypothetical protein
MDLAAAWRTSGLALGQRRGRAGASGADGTSLLVAGVVVEYGRPLHPVVVVAVGRQGTSCHLWPPAAVERTEAVKRFLAQVAREMAAFGAGPVGTTNISELL